MTLLLSGRNRDNSASVLETDNALMCPWGHCLFQERSHNWAFWVELDAINLKRLLIVFGHWTMTSPLRPVIFHISKDNYISLITDSINCQNCSFSHFADSPELGRHRKFEGLIIVLAHWTVIAWLKYMIFYIFIEKYSGLIPNSRNSKDLH